MWKIFKVDVLSALFLGPEVMLLLPGSLLILADDPRLGAPPSGLGMEKDRSINLKHS